MERPPEMPRPHSPLFALPPEQGFPLAPGSAAKAGDRDERKRKAKVNDVMKGDWPR